MQRIGDVEPRAGARKSFGCLVGLLKLPEEQKKQKHVSQVASREPVARGGARCGSRCLGDENALGGLRGSDVIPTLNPTP